MAYYGRKADGPLSVPKGTYEAADKSRKAASAVVKETLGVGLNGSITACHRLKNQARMIVRFSDMSDKDAVYDARLIELRDGEKIKVPENLTKQRSDAAKRLMALGMTGKIYQYHTRNENISARTPKEKKYTHLDPRLTDEELLELCEEARPLPSGVDRGNPQPDHSHRKTSPHDM